MDTKQKNLNDLGKKNPFIVPDGYFEQLTSNIMDQLPDKEPEKVVRVTLMDKVRPWLYMAAIFAGLGLFFKTLVGTDISKPVSNENIMEAQVVNLSDEELYWDCLETNYADDILIEEFDEFE